MPLSRGTRIGQYEIRERSLQVPRSLAVAARMVRLLTRAALIFWSQKMLLTGRRKPESRGLSRMSSEENWRASCSLSPVRP